MVLHFKPGSRSILFVSAYANPAMRATSREHLYSFRRYSEDNVYYLNLALKRVPDYVRRVPFDLVVFHTFFLTNHWRGRDHFRQLMSRAAALKNIQAVKAMLPQDEFIHSDLLSEFIREFSIDHVFSVAPPSTWRAIYRGVDFERVKFHNVLTGYLDEDRLPRIVAVGAASRGRPIDIGYRTAGKPVPWFGRHGFLKQRIADVFIEKAAAKGLVTDISTRDEDAIPGEAWYDFLARCKYTLGVESGTSLIDPDGTIRRRTEDYLAHHPEAPYENVEAACFPGLDGQVKLYALSPRHLEACVTRTCQILTEGDYNGILEAGTHYIPLKKDFSNIDEVLEKVVRDDGRERMTEKAYNDIVASGRYTYRHFVRTVVETSLDGPAACKTVPAGAALFHWMAFAEALERWAITCLYPFRTFMSPR
jgi:hypothetical protein